MSLSKRVAIYGGHVNTVFIFSQYTVYSRSKYIYIGLHVSGKKNMENDTHIDQGKQRPYLYSYKYTYANVFYS